jgi:hypothetical protein
MATSLPPAVFARLADQTKPIPDRRRDPGATGSDPAFAAKSLEIRDCANMIGFITGS